MLLYIGKVILLFTVSIIVIRMLGKAAFAQLTPHDLTAIIFLATMAVNPLLEESLVRVLTGIAVVTALHVLFSKLALFRLLNKLLVGEPTILVKHGRIIKANLRRTRYSLMELLATLRTEGYPDLDKIDYVILEPTGDISIIPNKDVVPVTPKHLKLDVKYEGMPVSIIIEGKLQKKNIRLIGKDEQWVKEKLAAEGFDSWNGVFYAAVKGNDDSLIVDTGEEGRNGY